MCPTIYLGTFSLSLELYHVIYFDHVSWNDGDELKSLEVEQGDGGEKRRYILILMIPIQFIHYLCEGNFHRDKFRSDMRVKQSRLPNAEHFCAPCCFTFSPNRMKRNRVGFLKKPIFKINLSPSRKFFIHVISLVEMSLEGKTSRSSFPFAAFLSRERSQCALLRIQLSGNEEEQNESFFPVASQKKWKRRKAIFH